MAPFRRRKPCIVLLSSLLGLLCLQYCISGVTGETQEPFSSSETTIWLPKSTFERVVTSTQANTPPSPTMQASGLEMTEDILFPFPSSTLAPIAVTTIVDSEFMQTTLLLLQPTAVSSRLPVTAPAASSGLHSIPPSPTPTLISEFQSRFQTTTVAPLTSLSPTVLPRTTPFPSGSVVGIVPSSSFGGTSILLSSNIIATEQGPSSSVQLPSLGGSSSAPLLRSSDIAVATSVTQPTSSLVATSVTQPTSSLVTTSVTQPTSSLVATSVTQPTSSLVATSVTQPTSSLVATSVTQPTSSLVATSVTQPTSSLVATSVTQPTSSLVATSVTQPTSSLVATSVTQPTSSLVATSVTQPTSSLVATSVTQPTSSLVATSVTQPTSSLVATSVTQPTSSLVATSVTQPTSSLVATSVTQPTSSLVATSVTQPTSSLVATSVTQPTSSLAATSVTQPTSSLVATSVTQPTSSLVATSVTQPTSSLVATSVTQPTSSLVATSVTQPTGSLVATSSSVQSPLLGFSFSPAPSLIPPSPSTPASSSVPPSPSSGTTPTETTEQSESSDILSTEVIVSAGGGAIILVLVLVICLIICCCICGNIRKKRRYAVRSSSNYLYANGRPPKRYRSSSGSPQAYELSCIQVEQGLPANSEIFENALVETDDFIKEEPSQTYSQLSAAGTDMLFQEPLAQLSPISYPSQLFASSQVYTIPVDNPEMQPKPPAMSSSSPYLDRFPNGPSLSVPTRMALSLQNEEMKGSKTSIPGSGSKSQSFQGSKASILGSKASIQGSRTSFQGSRTSFQGSRSSFLSATQSRDDLKTSGFSSRRAPSQEDDTLSLPLSGRPLSPMLKPDSLESSLDESQLPTRGSPLVPPLATSQLIGHGKKDFASLTCIPNHQAVELDMQDLKQKLTLSLTQGQGKEEPPSSERFINTEAPPSGRRVSPPKTNFGALTSVHAQTTLTQSPQEAADQRQTTTGSVPQNSNAMPGEPPEQEEQKEPASALKKPKPRKMSKLEKLTSLDYIRASLRMKKKKVSFQKTPEGTPKSKKKGKETEGMMFTNRTALDTDKEKERQREREREMEREREREMEREREREIDPARSPSPLPEPQRLLDDLTPQQEFQDNIYSPEIYPEEFSFHRHHPGRSRAYSDMPGPFAYPQLSQPAYYPHQMGSYHLNYPQLSQQYYPLSQGYSYPPPPQPYPPPTHPQVPLQMATGGPYSRRYSDTAPMPIRYPDQYPYTLNADQERLTNTKSPDKFTESSNMSERLQRARSPDRFTDSSTASDRYHTRSPDQYTNRYDTSDQYGSPDRFTDSSISNRYNGIPNSHRFSDVGIPSPRRFSDVGIHSPRRLSGVGMSDRMEQAQYRERTPDRLDGIGPVRYRERTPDRLDESEPAVYRERTPDSLDGLPPTRYRERTPDSLDRLQPTRYRERTPDSLDGLPPTRYRERTPDSLDGLPPTRYRERTPDGFYNMDYGRGYGIRSPFGSLDRRDLRSPERYGSLERRDLRSPERYGSLERRDLRSPERYGSLERRDLRSPERYGSLEHRNLRSPERYSTISEASDHMDTTSSKTKVSWNTEVIEYPRTPSDIDTDGEFNFQ